MKKAIKKLFCFIVILIYISYMPLSCFAEEENFEEVQEEEEEGFKVYSETAVLMELSTGKILYDKDCKKRMYPASTTKILTCIIALEECDLNEKAVASERAVALLEDGYTKANIVPGEEFTIYELLLLMQLQSANEAANIIAEHISGSIEDFAKLMNKRAKEMGCTGSNFVNPNGMHDEHHYSTAYDLAQITRYCMRNETYRKIMLTKKCEIPDTEIWENYKLENELEDEPYREFYNTNKLLQKNSEYYYPYCTSGKTGFTTPAKNCFVATSNKDGFELVSVIMHGELTDDDKSARYVDTINLFNYGYENYNLDEIKEEYKDKIEEVSSSSVEENKDEKKKEREEVVKKEPTKEEIDNARAFIMLGFGVVVLILGFLLLKLSTPRRKH